MEQRLKGPKCPLLPKTTVLPLHGGIPAPGLLPERSFFTVGHDDSFDWLSLSPSVTAYSVLTICVVPNSGKPPYWLSVSVKRYAPPFCLSEQHQRSGRDQAPYDRCPKGSQGESGGSIARSDWGGVKAPAVFSIRNTGKTSHENSGNQNCTSWAQGHVFGMSLAALQNDEAAFRKLRLMTEELQGTDCLASFHGVDRTCDKQCSPVKKWPTVIDAHADVTTTDGCLLCLLCVGFTKKHNNQSGKTSYAQHQPVGHVRKEMM